jgi:hypothetical protein
MLTPPDSSAAERIGARGIRFAAAPYNLVRIHAPSKILGLN